MTTVVRMICVTSEERLQLLYFSAIPITIRVARDEIAILTKVFPSRSVISSRRGFFNSVKARFAPGVPNPSIFFR